MDHAGQRGGVRWPARPERAAIEALSGAGSGRCTGRCRAAPDRGVPRLALSLRRLARLRARLSRRVRRGQGCGDRGRPRWRARSSGRRLPRRWPGTPPNSRRCSRSTASIPPASSIAGNPCCLPAYRGTRHRPRILRPRARPTRGPARGRKAAFTHIAFCAVVRAADDPRAPAGYRPLDAFWRKRGYRAGRRAWSAATAGRRSGRRARPKNRCSSG